jgi:hypothetical protein
MSLIHERFNAGKSGRWLLARSYTPTSPHAIYTDMRFVARRSVSNAFLLFLLLMATFASAQPVAVKYKEGTVHGFLSLKSADGKLLASGDLIQTVSGDRVTVHLVFHFKDGSLDDEQAVYSQRGSFRLISDRHVQSGPSFPKPIKMSIDVPGRKATVSYKDKDQEKTETEQLDLSPSLANGVLFNVLKNFPAGNAPLKLGFVVATPKPRLVQLNITRENEATFSFAGNPHKAGRFRIKIDIGGVTGAVAQIVGKQPADINVWILENHVPAFVRMEGALYEDGPPWTIELAAPSDFKPQGQ